MDGNEAFRRACRAYRLAAHEVGIIAGPYEDPANQADLTRFVRDTEKAFSREHARTNP